nr:peroxisome proliferator-activated receptor gamma coactivator-related protein 1-like [Dermacentor andersoni]
MRRWVSEDTTTTATHDDKDFRSASTGTAYTADETPSASFARAETPTAPAQDVSLGQLTYSINSSLPSSAQCKAPPCERHQRLRAVRHRGCQSEGQLRPILLPPPPRQPVNATPPLPPVPEGHQLGTTSQQAHGVFHQGQGGQGAQHPAETTQWTSGSSTGFTAGSVPLVPWHWRRSRCRHVANSDSSSSATTSSTSSSTTTSSSSSSSDTAPVLYAWGGLVFPFRY